MSVDEIIQSWQKSPNISPNITDLRVVPKREGQYCPFPEFIHSVLREAFRQKGIEKLYSHQAEAIEAIRQGKDIVIVTRPLQGKPSATTSLS